MKKLCWIVMAVVLIVGVVFTGCAKPAPPTSAPTTATTPQKPIELKFSHHNPPTGRTTVKFLDPLAKMIEDATNGRVKITMYPAESLHKSGEALEATIGGITDITWTILGNFPGRFPLTEVSQMPFLVLPSGKVDNRALSGGAINSHIIQELYGSFPEVQKEFADFKLLILHSCDPNFLATTKQPVHNMGDLKGLKIRELAGYGTEMWKLLGASPVNIPMPDQYEAASKGVIDGTNNPWSPLITYKLYEVFHYWTPAYNRGAGMMVIMNPGKWNSLPADIQKAIMSVCGINGAEFAGEAGWGAAVKDDVLAAAQKGGQKFEEVSLDPGELDKWKQIAGKPLWDKWVAEKEAKGLPGQKVLDGVLSLLEKYRIK